MTQGAEQEPNSVRFEPDDKIPLLMLCGLGTQLALLSVASIALVPVLVVRAAQAPDDYHQWAVFAAIAVSGVSTALQGLRLRRIGSGYLLLMGTSSPFIAVSITALAESGPALLATLVLAVAFLPMLVSRHLALVRRIMTPIVMGTITMLIAVSVMPPIFIMMTEEREGVSSAAGPLCTGITVIVITALGLRSNGQIRLWAPVIGIAVGCVIAAPFNYYDWDSVRSAAWFGFPTGSWPGFDLTFGTKFWVLLPAFALIMLIDLANTIGDCVSTQQASWRRERAVDYKAVQGALGADSLGNVLSGLAGITPNTSNSLSVSITEMTGIAARRVAVVVGVVFVVISSMPKVTALVLAIPNPVGGAYLAVLVALLFVGGMKMVAAEAEDYRHKMIAGIAFTIGLGFEDAAIFHQHITDLAGGFLEDGMVTGGLAAILMTLFLDITQSRPQRLTTEFDLSALPQIQSFLENFAQRNQWGESMAARLSAVGEETLLTLLDSRDEDEGSDGPGVLRIAASKRERQAVLDFVASTDADNLEDRAAVMSEQGVVSSFERDVSLRMLRHLTSSVTHRQYHGLDIVTVHVDTPKPPDKKQKIAQVDLEGLISGTKESASAQTPNTADKTEDAVGKEAEHSVSADELRPSN